jgi:hypothetical protein
VSDWDSRVTAALAGGVLLGALVAAAGPLARLTVGGGLGYECSSSGSFCVCRGVSDCLDLGKSKKCAGKEMLCGLGVCVCY